MTPRPIPPPVRVPSLDPQANLDHLLRIAVWEMVKGFGDPHELQRSIDTFLAAGAVWHGYRE